MSVMDYLRQKTFQRHRASEEQSQAVKSLIMELASEGKKIDGIMAIFLQNGKIKVMEGGLNDDFEAGVFLQRAEYLINRDGLVTR